MIDNAQILAHVHQTMAYDFARHSASHEGGNETGWTLLGTREGKTIVVRAILPAGPNKQASPTHIEFDHEFQRIMGMLYLLDDPQLKVVGIAHTHPNEDDYPSGDDFRADLAWLRMFPEKEALFGIGTYTGSELSFGWYALAIGHEVYRPVAMEIVRGY